MTDNRDAYRDAIQTLAQERRGVPFPSATVHHASVAVETMFLLSQKRVLILTGSVDRPIFSDPVVISAARRFLTAPGRTITAIMSQEGGSFSLFSDLLDLRESIKVSLLSPATAAGIPYRFVIGDDDMYRFEGDKNDMAGIAAFGDKIFSARLISIFDQLAKVSEPLAREAATA